MTDHESQEPALNLTTGWIERQSVVAWMEWAKARMARLEKARSQWEVNNIIAVNERNEFARQLDEALTRARDLSAQVKEQEKRAAALVAEIDSLKATVRGLEEWKKEREEKSVETLEIGGRVRLVETSFPSVPAGVVTAVIVGEGRAVSYRVRWWYGGIRHEAELAAAEVERAGDDDLPLPPPTVVGGFNIGVRPL